MDELERMAEDPDLLVSVMYECRQYRASLGDAQRGYHIHEVTPSFSAAVRWLQTQAQYAYPNSQYVRSLAGRLATT
jgi:hypothetical protein